MHFPAWYSEHPVASDWLRTALPIRFVAKLGMGLSELCAGRPGIQMVWKLR